MKEANTLAYYDMATITAVKSFAEQASAGSVKVIGREPKTCLGRVFNYKLGCFEDVH